MGIYVVSASLKGVDKNRRKASREGKFPFCSDRVCTPSTIYMKLKQQVMQMS